MLHLKAVDQLSRLVGSSMIMLDKLAPRSQWNAPRLERTMLDDFNHSHTDAQCGRVA